MKQQYSISQEEFELIEQYLNGKMPDNDAASFRLKLETDEHLQKKLEEVRLLILGINEAVLKDNLNKYHDNISKQANTGNKPAVVFHLKKIWLVAASILLIISLGFWWMANRKNKYEKLFATYYKPDPGLITAMGISDDYDFEKGMVEYKEGNYSKAIKAWSKLNPSQTKKDTVNYFLAMANLAINETEKAKGFLLQITGNSNKPFYKDACWYLGLLQLNDGEKANAIDWINKSGYPQSNDLINAINKK